MNVFLHHEFMTILQVDVDIGSSAVANGVLGLVFGVVTTLVVDMAFLIQVNKIPLDNLFASFRLHSSIQS